MRILHISSSDNVGGGARSAYRIHKELLRQGVDSKMYVKSKFSKDEEVIEYQAKRSALHPLSFKVKRRIDTRGLGYFSKTDTVYNGFSPAQSPESRSVVDQLPEADLITLNWVAGFWDYRWLKDLPQKTNSVIWRLSDMNPFTGGCFYDAGCGRFKQSCGKCPCLGSNSNKDISRRDLILKQEVISSLPRGFLHIAAQSQWIAEEVKSSAVFGDLSVSHMPNGIDSQAFSPANAEQWRLEHGIQKQERVIMFIAQSLNNPRKGAKYVYQSLKHLLSSGVEDLVLLAVGKDELPKMEGIKIVQFDNLSTSEELSMAYSAADIYLISSLQDNLPNTVLESMACGTAVVGFNVGGIPDLVQEGQEGYLVESEDAKALALALYKLLSDKHLCQKMGQSARRRVLDHYKIEDLTANYLKLYRKLTQ